jgi:hypothetical protein
MCHPGNEHLAGDGLRDFGTIGRERHAGGGIKNDRGAEHQRTIKKSLSSTSPCSAVAAFSTWILKAIQMAINARADLGGRRRSQNH